MIEWTPALSTGVTEIDVQHQEIFCWLAELEGAATSDRMMFGGYVFVRLKGYIRDHFSAEEALMRAAGYPHLEAHLAEHAAFRTRVNELQRKSAGHDVTLETVEFLRHWLTTHIAETDMAFVPYLNSGK